MLVNKNIIKNRNDITYKVFTNYITANFVGDPSLPNSMKPSDYVAECWRRYKSNASTAAYKCSNSLNGKIFEVIIATAFYRNNILPFYTQAKDVDYDIVMYDKEKKIPITISTKTSARERYKQADLEAYAFKNMHRSALNYLIMLSRKDCANIQKKIDYGMLIGLKQVIQADAKEFDILVQELKKRDLGEAPQITLFDGQKIE